MQNALDGTINIPQSLHTDIHANLCAAKVLHETIQCYVLNIETPFLHSINYTRQWPKRVEQDLVFDGENSHCDES